MPKTQNKGQNDIMCSHKDTEYSSYGLIWSKRAPRICWWKHCASRSIQEGGEANDKIACFCLDCLSGLTITSMKRNNERLGGKQEEGGRALSAREKLEESRGEKGA